MKMDTNAKGSTKSSRKDSQVKATTNKADIAFLKDMIPHHKAALPTARAAVKSGKNPVVAKIAANILKTQTKEIAEMEAVLKAVGEKPNSEHSSHMGH